MLCKKIPLFSRNTHGSCGEKGFPGGAVVKNSPAGSGDARDAGLIPGLEDPLETEMANHSSVLAWRIPWTEKPVHGVAKSRTRLSDYTFSFRERKQ